MNASQAQSLYSENWDREFTTMDELNARIKSLSENGAYSCCVYVDSKKILEEVRGNLLSAKFNVEDYNGGNNNILEVNWG